MITGSHSQEDADGAQDRERCAGARSTVVRRDAAAKVTLDARRSLSSRRREPVSRPLCALKTHLEHGEPLGDHEVGQREQAEQVGLVLGQALVGMSAKKYESTTGTSRGDDVARTLAAGRAAGSAATAAGAAARSGYRVARVAAYKLAALRGRSSEMLASPTQALAEFRTRTEPSAPLKPELATKLSAEIQALDEPPLLVHYLAVGQGARGPAVDRLCREGGLGHLAARWSLRSGSAERGCGREAADRFSAQTVRTRRMQRTHDSRGAAAYGCQSIDFKIGTRLAPKTKPARGGLCGFEPSG